MSRSCGLKGYSNNFNSLYIKKQLIPPQPRKAPYQYKIVSRFYETSVAGLKKILYNQKNEVPDVVI